jgi:UDP-2,3-diacylglucosamine hydrolase
MNRPAYIASDIHLGAVPVATERAFVDFLRHVRDAASSLLVAGDLFDFWFEYGPIIPGRHFRVLAALAEVAEAGVPVTLAGGNHDAWGGRFLTEEVGIEYHADPFRIILSGRRALVAHGDGVGRGDLKYRMLKTLLRSRATIAGFRAIHPEIGLRIAGAVSSTEAKSTGDGGAAGRARHIETWALAQLEAEPALELVVCGHAHQPAITGVGNNRYYLNAGDWITDFTYITVPASGAPTLHRWPVRD